MRILNDKKNYSIEKKSTLISSIEDQSLFMRTILRLPKYSFFLVILYFLKYFDDNIFKIFLFQKMERIVCI